MATVSVGEGDVDLLLEAGAPRGAYFIESDEDVELGATRGEARDQGRPLPADAPASINIQKRREEVWVFAPDAEAEITIYEMGFELNLFPGVRNLRITRIDDVQTVETIETIEGQEPTSTSDDDFGDSDTVALEIGPRRSLVIQWRNTDTHGEIELETSEDGNDWWPFYSFETDAEADPDDDFRHVGDVAARWVRATGADGLDTELRLTAS